MRKLQSKTVICQSTHKCILSILSVKCRNSLTVSYYFSLMRIRQVAHITLLNCTNRLDLRTERPMADLLSNLLLLILINSGHVGQDHKKALHANTSMSARRGSPHMKHCISDSIKAHAIDFTRTFFCDIHAAIFI